MSEAAAWGAMRTVCHGCRTMREVIEQVGPHRFAARDMIIPGDGTVYRRVKAAFDPPDAVVETPCPACAGRTTSADDAGCGTRDEDLDDLDDLDEDDEDDLDWLLPGFVPPV